MYRAGPALTALSAGGMLRGVLRFYNLTISSSSDGNLTFSQQRRQRKALNSESKAAGTTHSWRLMNGGLKFNEALPTKKKKKNKKKKKITKKHLCERGVYFSKVLVVLFIALICSLN